MNTVSKSTFGTFNSCERKYYYSQLEFKIVPNKYMQYGLDFHVLLEKYNKIEISDYEKPQKTIKVPEKFKVQFDNYIKIISKLKSEGWRIQATEIRLSYENITGIIDLVMAKENKYLIVDFKTIPRFNQFDASKYEPEMLIYSYLFEKSNNINTNNIELAIFRFEQEGENYDINYIENDVLKRHFWIESVNLMHEKITKSIGSIKDFPKIDINNKGFVCKYCDFFDICIKE